METTTIGERGQVVIPQAVREDLKLAKGDLLMVAHDKDSIVLKPFRFDKKTFEDMLAHGHARAKKLGLTEQDMWDAIKRARQK